MDMGRLISVLSRNETALFLFFPTNKKGVHMAPVEPNKVDNEKGEMKD